MTHSKKNNSVEKILEESNSVLTSFWAKLASLIMAYEAVQWKEAVLKSRKLLEEKQANKYIDEIRAIFDGSKTKVNTPQKKKNKPKKKLRREREFMNYRRLLKIAPNLEEMLLSGKEVYGKSIVTGYMDFNLELINQNERGYYLAMSHYYLQNGDLIPDPDMVIRVNIEHGFLEALTFQNNFGYKEIYDNYLNPTTVKPKEKKNQNAFLDSWLRNLIKQGHLVEFKEIQEVLPISETPEKETDTKKDKKIENKPKEDSKPKIKPQKDVLIDDTDYIETTKHWAKLALVIRQVEGIDNEASKKKAIELKKSNRAEDYILRAFNRNSAKGVNQLLKSNYQLLLKILPSIAKSPIKDKKGVLISNKSNASKIKFEGMESISATKQTLSFQEGAKGIQIIAINRINQKIWLLSRNGNFDNKANYDNENVDIYQKQKANNELKEWLNKLLKNNFFDQESQKETEAKKELEEPTQKENNKKAKEIPNFKKGKVKLVEAHIAVGLDQEDIDLINKTKKGFTITPIAEMKNKTESFSADAQKKALKPGYRISNTGKLYFENRSNRSDLTDEGL